MHSVRKSFALLNMTIYCKKLLLILVLIALAGCATTEAFVPEEADSAKRKLITSVKYTDYYLQPGDQLDAKFYYTPNLNENLIIRPDGKISLQLIGEIEAAGLTPVELEKRLIEKYSDILAKPEVTVIIRKFASSKAYIGGEVAIPGVVTLDNNITVLQAIIQAGGFKNSSEKQSVMILRKTASENPLLIKLDITKHLENPGLESMLLEPYDIVYVPKTVIARMDQFVEEYMERLLPFSMNIGLGFNYNLNPEMKISQ